MGRAQMERVQEAAAKRRGRMRLISGSSGREGENANLGASGEANFWKELEGMFSPIGEKEEG